LSALHTSAKEFSHERLSCTQQKWAQKQKQLVKNVGLNDNTAEQENATPILDGQ